MLDCIILGDSIALGTQRYKPECVVQARSGINSWQYNRLYKDSVAAKIVVISLGTNDHAAVHTHRELQELRQRVVQGARVYWILPATKFNTRSIVQKIALDRGDTVLIIRDLANDGVHPSGSGYTQLAAAIQ